MRKKRKKTSPSERVHTIGNFGGGHWELTPISPLNQNQKNKNKPTIKHHSIISVFPSLHPRPPFPTYDYTPINVSSTQREKNNTSIIQDSIKNDCTI
jgi:hypothetical protein